MTTDHATIAIEKGEEVSIRLHADIEEKEGLQTANVWGVLPGSTDTDMLRGSGFAPELTADQVARILAFMAGLAPPAMNGAALELFD